MWKNITCLLSRGGDDALIKETEGMLERGNGKTLENTSFMYMTIIFCWHKNEKILWLNLTLKCVNLKKKVTTWFKWNALDNKIPGEIGNNFCA